MSRRARRPWSSTLRGAVIGALVGLWACGQDAPTRPDARAEVDGAVALDAGAADAADRRDAGGIGDARAAEDLGRDADGGAPPADAGGLDDAGTSEGTSVAFAYRGVTGTFDRAFVGYVSDTVGGTPRGLYFELSRGADDACPSETSPVPQQILTVDGFASASAGVQSDGLSVRFFDFEGRFRTEIAPDTATTARVEIASLDLDEGTVAGAVELTFGDGDAVGRFHATHCASLDSPLP